MSRIDRKKNLEGLLEALRLIRARNPKLTLNIAGDGDPNYIVALQSLARRLTIDGQINWLGYLQGARKREVLESASAFVLPSYSENFGIAVAEALAAGLPCLVSRGVAISDEIEKAGAGVVTGTTPEEIATGLERLLGDPSGMASISAAARTLASDKFSLDAMGSALKRCTAILSLQCRAGG